MSAPVSPNTQSSAAPLNTPMVQPESAGALANMVTQQWAAYFNQVQQNLAGTPDGAAVNRSGAPITYGAQQTPARQPLADAKGEHLSVRMFASPSAQALGIDMMDGQSHPLSGIYSSLAAAQNDYPGAALTDELFAAALQAAVSNSQGRFIQIPAGGARLNRRINISVNGTVLDLAGVAITCSGVAAVQNPFGTYVEVTGDNCWITASAPSSITMANNAQACGITFRHQSGGGVIGIELNGNKANVAAPVDDTFCTGIQILEDVVGVSAATSTTPVKLTSNDHPFRAGDSVAYTGIGIVANGSYYVQVVDANTVSLYADAALTMPVAPSGAFTSGGYGTRLSDQCNLTIERCHIHDWAHYSVTSFGRWAGNLEIRFNRIHDNGTPTDANSTGTGLMINKWNGYHRIVGNRCYNHKLSGIELTAVGDPAASVHFENLDSLIAHNHCFANTVDGIRLIEQQDFGSSTSIGSRRTIIANNHCYSNTQVGIRLATNLAGGTAYGRIEDVLVIGNQVHDNASYGILCAGTTNSSSTTQRIQIAMNTALSNLVGIGIGSGCIDVTAIGNLCWLNSQQDIQDFGTSTQRYWNRESQFADNTAWLWNDLYLRGNNGLATIEPQGIPISNATNASPIVITTNKPHGRSTGDTVRVGGCVGNTAANSSAGTPSWTVTVTDAYTLSLNGSTGNGIYGGGGALYFATPQLSLSQQGLGTAYFEYKPTGGFAIGTQSAGDIFTFVPAYGASGLPALALPIVLAMQALLGTPQAGALEHDGTYLYYTDNTASRHQITGGATGSFSYSKPAGGSGTLVFSNGRVVSAT